jgi:RNA polymerase sporulation-specific sigma factor
LILWGLLKLMFSIIGFAAANLIYLVLHVTNSGSFPKPLSAAEEHECLIKLKNGDSNARNVLIERNLRLVAHIIKKYYSNSKDQDDLISIGTIGLIKAVSTFDGDKGTRLATYAARCIENAMFTQRLIRTCKTHTLFLLMKNGSRSATLVITLY